MLAGVAACSQAPPTPSAQSAPPPLAAETPEPQLAGGPAPTETIIATAGGRDAKLEAQAAATTAISIASLPPSQASAVVGASLDDTNPLQRLSHVDQDVRLVVLSRTSTLRAPGPSEPVQQGLGQAIANLDEPGTVANQTLQRKPARALRSSARFLISSTLGLAGLFDVGLKFGLKHIRTDSSQTVASYGPGAWPPPALVRSNRSPL
jgi:phospholipid-binding lipoprotein MlaA